MPKVVTKKRGSVVERQHHKYGRSGQNTIKVVSADSFIFYFTQPELYMSSVFRDLLAMASDGQSDEGIHLLDEEFETHTSISLILDLLRDRRIDGEEPFERPTSEVFFEALRFAHKYEYGTVYKILVGFIEGCLVDSTYRPHEAFTALCLAAMVDDTVLARHAVERLEKQAATCSQSYSTHYVNTPDEEPLLKYYLGAWTPHDFNHMPKAYVYAMSKLPPAKSRSSQNGVKPSSIAGPIFTAHVREYERVMEREQYRAASLTEQEIEMST